MRAFIATIWVLSAIFAIWLQFRYKDANYPNNWQWRTKLFLSGSVTGALGALVFLIGTDVQVMLIAVFYGGLFLGLLFGFASPHSMKGIYPKRTENKQGSSDEESNLNSLDTKN